MSENNKNIKIPPPPLLEDLPLEDQERWKGQLKSNLSEEELNLINAPINRQVMETEQVPIEEPKFQALPTNQLVDLMNKESLMNVQNFARFDTYDIELDTGKIEKYVRRSPVQYELDELLDLQTEVQARKEMGTKKELDEIDVRVKSKLLAELTAKYYLINVRTKQPMTNEERLHVAYPADLYGILGACLLRSLQGAPEKNRSGPIGKRQ